MLYSIQRAAVITDTYAMFVSFRWPVCSLHAGLALRTTSAPGGRAAARIARARRPAVQ
ncbi:hypothetical protein HMPREF0972_00331 [Actinomyces sp. oral taxon 848 str. F0332]|nr:hypothetical protein HMPREF0972_00331 [Actinomyces sp. oral taxon 848 str. F0332]